MAQQVEPEPKQKRKKYNKFKTNNSNFRFFLLWSGLLHILKLIINNYTIIKI